MGDHRRHRIARHFGLVVDTDPLNAQQHILIDGRLPFNAQVRSSAAMRSLETVADPTLERPDQPTERFGVSRAPPPGQAVRSTA
jgi:hypothetical protein